MRRVLTTSLAQIGVKELIMKKRNAKYANARNAKVEHWRTEHLPQLIVRSVGEAHHTMF